MDGLIAAAVVGALPREAAWRIRTSLCLPFWKFSTRAGDVSLPFLFEPAGQETGWRTRGVTIRGTFRSAHRRSPCASMIDQQIESPVPNRSAWSCRRPRGGLETSTEYREDLFRGLSHV
jgi:hypothetical protein